MITLHRTQRTAKGSASLHLGAVRFSISHSREEIPFLEDQKTDPNQIVALALFSEVGLLVSLTAMLSGEQGLCFGVKQSGS
ncbi:hypothetical protein AC630_13030 [Bradyrhizobium sp. AS23.2]|nr:hypothetical protein AC630_13030 [Bradyrhizobium sp. AS23.2]